MIYREKEVLNLEKDPNIIQNPHSSIKRTRNITRAKKKHQLKSPEYFSILDRF